MTLQSLLHPIALPQSPRGMAANGTTAFFSLGTLDAAAEELAQIVLLTKAGNISKVHFRTGTVTTGDDVLVKLETVDQATGNPTGTLWGANTSQTVTIANGDDDTWKTAELTADATINAADVGKPIAIVINAPGGFSGDLEIDYAGGYFRSDRKDYDNSVWFRKYLLGSWTVDGYSYNEAAAVRLEYDDGSFAFIPGSYAGDANTSSQTFDVDTTPDEVGIKLRIPFACRACGVWLASTYLREDMAVKVYDASDVEQMTLPAWYRGWSARSTNYKGITYIYGDTFTVAANAWYRIAFQPTTSDGTGLIAFYVPQATAAHWAQWGLDQDDYKWTERTNAGAWTDRDERILFGGFLVDQFHDGAGGAGGGGANWVIGG